MTSLRRFISGHAWLPRFACSAAVIATLFGALSVVATPVFAQEQKRLTLDQALGFGGETNAIPRLRWLRSVPDGGAPTLVENRFENGKVAVLRIDARTGASTPLYDVAAMTAAFAALPNMTADRAKQIAENAPALRMDENDKRALVIVGGDVYAYDFETKRAARVTESPREQRMDLSIAPDGSHIAYTLNNDLYVASVHWDTGKPTAPRRVTTDGSARIYNGRLDWVYEEEVYGRGTTGAYRWSDDGKQIAFLRLDDSQVPQIAITDHITRIPAVEEELYPKAGDPNPKVMVGMTSVASDSAPIVWTDLSAYPEDNRLVVRFDWSPSNDLVIQVQNRIQNFLHLLRVNPATGKTTKLLEETSTAWVDMMDDPYFLKDGSFLWRSGRTGFRHLYHYSADGSLRGAVTRGDWDVTDLLSVDEKTRTIYFDSNQTGATQSQTYRARLDGSDGDKPTQLTKSSGNHDASFDPSNTLFLDRWSSMNTPAKLGLNAAADGAEVRPLGANLVSNTRRDFNLSTPELVTIKARDGYPLDAIILKPADFSPTRKYPIVYCLYGGPASPTVTDRWGVVSLWHHYLAQQGCIVFMCDNRSASSKGVKNVQSIYKHIGESELRDVEDALGYMKTLPYADTTRVGVYGWSFGGFMVEYMMTHSNLFAVGAAGGGVADWKLYDSIYTERYMSTPQENPDGYRTSAPINAASQLSGKLLLLHGTMDDNVHMQNTLQLAYELQRANKMFDMMLYPRARHGVGDPAQSRQMRTLLTNYLLDNLHAR